MTFLLYFSSHFFAPTRLEKMRKDPDNYRMKSRQTLILYIVCYVISTSYVFTMATSPFGTGNESNPNFAKLLEDLTEWRDLHPAPFKWLTPTEFTREYPQFKTFESSEFRSKYYQAKNKIRKGKLIITFVCSTVFSFAPLLTKLCSQK